MSVLPSSRNICGVYELRFVWPRAPNRPHALRSRAEGDCADLRPNGQREIPKQSTLSRRLKSVTPARCSSRGRRAIPERRLFRRARWGDVPGANGLVGESSRLLDNVLTNPEDKGIYFCRSKLTANENPARRKERHVWARCRAQPWETSSARRRIFLFLSPVNP
jgi:hypothetical protein